MINVSEAQISFFQSLLSTEGSVMRTSQVLDWVEQRRSSVRVQIDQIPFSKLRNWAFDMDTGNLKHSSGKFFSIEGISIVTNNGNVREWSQPIINQPEVGFLGIIAKKFDGVLHFLMQAKIEPGNINFVQLSPTLQATKSNYTRVHDGKSPQYLEYFNGIKKVRILLDQLQSEQGARFVKKRNRNIIVEVDEDIQVYDNYCWLTLGQIKSLMRVDNLINMDTRTVLSGISYGTYSANGIELIERLVEKRSAGVPDLKSMLTSMLDGTTALSTTEEIISWITSLKIKYELQVDLIPLRDVKCWKKDEWSIHHEMNKYFSVIAADIVIDNREVVGWTQPLIKSAQEGIIAFIIKKINGVYHFMVQAKVEAGNFDILELAPTVQCLTGNYRKGENEYEVPFLNYVLEAKDSSVIYRAMQSEEGGRFYREQNLNLIVVADEGSFEDIPENFCWMTLSQLYTFIKFNNYLNIQARCLISAILI